MFDHDMSVRLRHTDAAGVVFYAEQFSLAHEAYEAFLDARGLSLSRFLDAGEVHIPIVHAEADYQAPLHLGDRIRMELRCDRVGHSSFALETRIVRTTDETTASVITTVHVAIDSESRKKVAIPDPLRAAVEEL